MAAAELPYGAGLAIDDPAKFSEFWLLRKLWAKQQEIAYSVQNNLLTAVKGCHASGKTYLASGLPLWWLVKHQQGKVFTTAPTLRQVKMFWEEISLARRNSHVAQLLPECTTTGLKVSEDRYAMGASSSRGVNVQGFHGKDVLIICDEAPGIESDVWDAIEGIRAGGRVRVLKMGNPVVPAGEFFDAFGRGRAIHNCISISAFDSPNLQHPDGRALTFEELMSLNDEQLDYAPFPFLITRRWVKERYIAWGPTHPKFRSRVLAEFPNQSPYSVFELAWIEKAKRDAFEKEVRNAQRFAIQVGIDVAGPGDDETTLCARVAGMILEQHAWNDNDPRGPVVKVLAGLRHHPLYKLGAVVIDCAGIGHNFALHIADQGFPVYGFNSGWAPMDKTQYANAKSEAYFQCREWFKHGLVSGLSDEECEAQLSTMLYWENARGLTEIRSKEYMRKQGVPSPDRAEALIMAFLEVVPRNQQVVYQQPQYPVI